MTENRQSDAARLFEGRVAAVSGAGKGLGRAHALWLAAHGCAVVVNNRVHPGVPSSAQSVVDEIVQAGGSAVAHEGPIDEKESAAALVQLAIDTYGKLDILVCNAGVMPEAPFADADLNDLDSLISTNVLGTIYPLHAAWRHMLETGYGRIVLTSSTVGTYGHGGVAAYGASRSAVIGLARSLTLEKPASADIGINVILPFAYTNMSASAMEAVLDPETINALLPDKISPVVGWLSSEGCRRSGEMFHASALKVSRVAIVESKAVVVDPSNIDALSRADFPLEPLFEPLDSGAAVGRLLSGAGD